MTFSPQKKWYVHWNGLSGVPLRPKTNASHGATLDRQGTPLASHWSATGLTVSGVEATSMRSILSLRISWLATSEARRGSDSLSLTTRSMGKRLAPRRTPERSCGRRASMTKLSASPNGASGPVCGVTYASLMVLPAAPPASVDDLFPPQLARTTPAPADPAAPMKRRRVRGSAEYLLVTRLDL